MSIVVPFFGTLEEAAETAGELKRLVLEPADELVIVDNTPSQVFAAAADEMTPVIPAREQQSSYYARNVGAENTTGEWLLFIDSDCLPPPGLVDDFLSSHIPDQCGLVAGNVESAEQHARIARYCRSRGHINTTHHLDGGPYPAGITANLLVRRGAWNSVGGFLEGIRSGADVEFCWRVQEAGWSFLYRRGATVEHRHPTRVGPMLRKAIRHSGGRAWVNRRHKGSMPRPKLLRPLARCAAGGAAWTLTLKFERALFKGIDALWVLADAYGYFAADNRASSDGQSTAVHIRQDPTARHVLALNDIFPAASETFIFKEIRSLRSLGVEVRNEALARPARANREASRELPCAYLEDDTIASKLLAVTWLMVRHPVRCILDRFNRRRWRREEEAWPLRSLAPQARRLVRSGEHHIHVNFAAGAALNALRLGRLTGLPYSLTAHGYDIYKSPANLEEKLRGAAFAMGTCDYTVAHLRKVAGPGASNSIGKLIMGVDPTEFRRQEPYPGGRTVVAIGRYVEKKGFSLLIEAVAAMQESAPLERVVIAGEGPLRRELTNLKLRLGLDDLVELPSLWSQKEIYELLQDADLLVAPCVVAEDGDRDSMPVVVKEALAMEVPVVGSDEVGLPEMIQSEWGRLVPPGDSAAIAEATRDLLALPVVHRQEMGLAGRAWVEANCSLATETKRLADALAGHRV